MNIQCGLVTSQYERLLLCYLALITRAGAYDFMKEKF